MSERKLRQALLAMVAVLLLSLWANNSWHERRERTLDGLNDQAARTGFGIGYSVGFEDATNHHPARYDLDGVELAD